MTRDDIDNAVLVLENDSEFYRSFLAIYDMTDRDASDARNLIQRHLRRLKLPEGCIADREAMRFYFEDRYNLETKYTCVKAATFDLVGPKAKKADTQPTTVMVANVDNIDTLVAAVRSKLQTTFPEHKAMNTNILTLTTKHYINGTDIASLTNSQLYQMIAQQEASIKDLEAIANKPNSLTKEIADRKASIQTLVDFLNSRDTKTA